MMEINLHRFSIHLNIIRQIFVSMNVLKVIQPAGTLYRLTTAYDFYQCGV